ncbi:hypothetical protein SAMN05192574_102996 [Mucilaginibacter gossypiicola]|uniref:Uncharacterized protein n=1 Tax=Mucilaginibacter gossypiicola TaxID=551995 RepID=A0A1H8F8W2_9SPHI|nr:hypothetical protein SAMN05192574_102996 [Mucilaginibacter gossypiicola]
MGRRGNPVALQSEMDIHSVSLRGLLRYRLITLVVFNKHWPAQLPREGCYFCLDTKVTKKSSQQGGFFAAQAFAHLSFPGLCPAKRTEPRAAIILPCFTRSWPRFCKNLLCPCNRTTHHCSARFRPKLTC